jgi:hypothetical protein
VIDPLGALVTELRNANIASGRVRGGEPAEGDAKGAGEYQRFVVLTRLGAIRQHRAPVQEVRIGVRAYGATYQDAAALYGEISDVVDNAGPRLVGSKAIYQSLDDTGGEASKDPDTGQPYEIGVIALYAGTQAFA